MSKRIFSITLAVLTLCCFASSCVKEKGFEDRVKEIVQADSLNARMAALEVQMKQINDKVTSLKTIVDALQENLYITKVEETEEGCKLTFSNGKTVTIKNGKDAPVVGVKDSLGIYYWVLVDKTQTPADTSWILDNKQNKIPVSGKDGAEIGVKDSASVLYWVRIDKMTTPPDTTYLRDKEGKKIQAEGNGDSWFSKVEKKNGYVILTLTAGGTIELPYKSELDKLVARIQKIDVIPDYGDGSVKLNNGWNLVSFAISPDSLAPKLAEGFKDKKTKFTFLMIQTLTKAVTYDTLDVTNVEVESNGNLEVTVRGEKIKSYYHKENGKTGNGCLKISDTVNCCTSGYFSLSRAQYPGFEDTLCYAVKDIVWAPVNCGYSDSTKYGLLYQFGRKAGSGYNDGATYKEKAQTIVTATFPVGGYNKNPEDTAFYSRLDGKKDWYTESGTQLSEWPMKDPDGTTGIGNPCPEGWRVPTEQELRILHDGGKGTWWGAKFETREGQNGFWFNGTGAGAKSGVFLSSTGSIDHYTSATGGYNYRQIMGSYWSVTIGDNGYPMALVVNTDPDDYQGAYVSSGQWAANRAEGASVRCVQE